MAGTVGTASTFSEILVLERLALVSFPCEPRLRFWLSFRLVLPPGVGTLLSLDSYAGSLGACSGGRDREVAMLGSVDVVDFLDLRPKGQMPISSSVRSSNASPPLARRLLRRKHRRTDSLNSVRPWPANQVASEKRGGLKRSDDEHQMRVILTVED